MSTKTRGKMSLLNLMMERNLIDTPAHGRALIMAGKVIVGEQRVDKPGILIPQTAEIRIKDAARFVGRGGSKLLSAIENLGMQKEIEGAILLDIGASTGGFTDCLLQHQAKKVIALDVGTNQLAWKLRNDPRVVSLEQTDIRNFPADEYPKIDLVVGDISFNSLARLAPMIVEVVKNPDAKYIMLVKPQFELDRNQVPPGGIITDKELQDVAVERVKNAFFQVGYDCCGVEKSALQGRQGNQEYFCLFVRRKLETTG